MAKHTDKTNLETARHRHGFSGFSQSYPGGLDGNKTSYAEKMRRRKIVSWVLIAAGIIVLFILGFIMTDVMLEISKSPPETTAAFIMPGLQPIF